MHVLFSLAALFATRARARARAHARFVFTGSTFALIVDLSTLPMFLQPFRTRFLNLQSHRESLTQMLDNTSH